MNLSKTIAASVCTVVLAVLAGAASVQAGGNTGVATVHVFSGASPTERHYHVDPPAGWTCNLSDGSGDPQNLSCYDNSVGIAVCGSVTASVTITAGIGGVIAEAICGTTTGQCPAFSPAVFPVTSSTCSVTVRSNGVPFCNWVTLPGVGLSYTASCVFGP